MEITRAGQTNERELLTVLVGGEWKDWTGKDPELWGGMIWIQIPAVPYQM